MGIQSENMQLALTESPHRRTNPVRNCKYQADDGETF